MVTCWLQLTTLLLSLRRFVTSNSPSKLKVLILDVDGTLYDSDTKIESQIATKCDEYSSLHGYSPADSQELYLKYGSTYRGISSVVRDSPNASFTKYSKFVFSNLNLRSLRKYSYPLNHRFSTGYSSQDSIALHSIQYLDNPLVIASNSPLFHVKRVMTRLGLSNLPIQQYYTPDSTNGLTKTDINFWNHLFEQFPKSQFSHTLIDDNKLNIQLAHSLQIQTIHVNQDLSFAESLLHFLDVYPSSLVSLPKQQSYSAAFSSDQNLFKFDSCAYLESKNKIDRKSFNQATRGQLIKELSKSCFNVNVTTLNPIRVVDIGAGLLNMLNETIDIISHAYSLALLGASHSLTAPTETIDPTISIVYVAIESNLNLYPTIIQKLNLQGFIQLESDGFDTRANISTFFGVLNCIQSIQVHATIKLMPIDFMSVEVIDYINKILASTDSSSQLHGDLNNCPVYTEDEKAKKRASVVDLIVGCCVADLVPPRVLANQLLEINGDSGALLYLPITFVGRTILSRQKLSEHAAIADYELDTKSSLVEFKQFNEHLKLRIDSNDLHDHVNTNEVVPPLKDTEIFDLYHTHLRNSGHYLDPIQLLSELQNYGCTIISPLDCDSSHQTEIIATQQCVDGTHGHHPTYNCLNRLHMTKYLEDSISDWHINPSDHPFMWRCMLRFIALGVVFTSMDIKKCYDSRVISWIKDLLTVSGSSCHLEAVKESAELERVELIASNIDILARLPRLELSDHGHCN